MTDNPSSFNEAQTILGPDFITPHALMQETRFFYPLEEVEAWERMLPPGNVLTQLKLASAILVPPPPADFTLSLSALDTLVPDLFGRGVRQTLRTEPFAQVEQKIDRPFAVRARPLARSDKKGLSGQLQLLGKDQTLPTALELAWALTCAYVVSDRRLFEHSVVRTDTGRGEGRVLIGGNVPGGYIVKRGVGDMLCKEALGITNIWRF